MRSVERASTDCCAAIVIALRPRFGEGPARSVSRARYATGMAIAAALGSNLIVKTVLAFTAGGRRFGLGFLSCMAAPAALFGVATAVVTAALPQ